MFKTSLYLIMDKHHRDELELCYRHAKIWESKGNTVTPIAKRSIPLWWGDEADGEMCESCEAEHEDSSYDACERRDLGISLKEKD